MKQIKALLAWKHKLVVLDSLASCLWPWGLWKHREACLMKRSRQTGAGNEEAAGVHELQKITMNTSAPVPQAMHELQKMTMNTSAPVPQAMHELQKITMNTSAPVPQAMHEVHTYLQHTSDHVLHSQ